MSVFSNFPLFGEVIQLVGLFKRLRGKRDRTSGAPSASNDPKGDNAANGNNRADGANGTGSSGIGEDGTGQTAFSDEQNGGTAGFEIDKPLSILMIGPTQNGKSVLLMALHHGADVDMPTDTEFEPFVSEQDMNEDMREYASAFDSQFSEDSHYIASTEIRELSFTLELAGKVSGTSQQGPFRFRVMDVFGGALEAQANLPGASDPEQTTKVERQEKIDAFAESADAAILCLSSQDSVTGLPAEYANFRSKVNLLPEDAPLIVCFTKFERLFFPPERGFGLGAQALAHAMNRDEVKKRLARIVARNKSFSRALTHVEFKDRPVWICPVSSFGFIRENGAPNSEGIETEGDGRSGRRNGFEKLLIRATEGDDTRPRMSVDVAKRYWMPYAIYDPFIFVATRAPTRLMFSRQELEAYNEDDPSTY